MRRVLVKARAIWSDGEISIIDSVREAAAGSMSESYHALVELRRLLLTLDLDQWERHPARLRAETRSLFTRTIGRLTNHRGGWRCSKCHPEEGAHS